MKTVLSVVAILACFAAAAERQPLDRYQPIIDRQMFGQPPPNFDPTRPASEAPKGNFTEKELTKEQAALKSSIHFSVINVTPDGATAVGFTDNSNPKAPIHYYLKVGEERNGWKVIEADPVAAKMKIAKDDIEVALDLGANSAKGGATARAGGPGVGTPGGVGASGGPRAGGGLLGNRRGGLLGGRNVGMPEGGSEGVARLGSLRERRAAREQERAAEAAAMEKAAKEREAQRAAEAAEKEKEREAELAAQREEQRRELQLLRDELKADREERERAQREAKQRNEDAENND